MADASYVFVLLNSDGIAVVDAIEGQGITNVETITLPTNVDRNLSSIALSPDEKWIVVGSKSDLYIAVAPFNSGDIGAWVETAVSDAVSRFGSLAFSPTEHDLFAYVAFGEFQLFRIQSDGSIVAESTLQTNGDSGAAWSAAGDRVLYNIGGFSAGPGLYSWDGNDVTQLDTLYFDSPLWLLTMANDQFIVTQNGADPIKLISIDNDTLTELDSFVFDQSNFSVAGVSASKTHFAIGNRDSEDTPRIWKVEDDTISEVVQIPDYELYGLQFTGDDKGVLGWDVGTVGNDGTLHFFEWDGGTGLVEVGDSWVIDGFDEPRAIIRTSLVAEVEGDIILHDSSWFGEADGLPFVPFKAFDETIGESGGWESYAITNEDELVTQLLDVTSISPASGDVAGGTSVTITGTFDTGAASTTVTIGGSAATSVTVVDGTTITCDTPSGTAGDADVVVDQDGDTATLVDGFEYESLIQVELTTIGAGTWNVPAGVSNLEDVLIVAGGGGGGSRQGGGGGAGEVVHLTDVAVTPGGTVSYTVGGGGAGGTGGGLGSSGDDTVFGATTALGGGGGAGRTSGSAGASGGSGGGGANGTSGGAATASSGVGNAGGDGNPSLGNSGGGGGGAGEVGEDALATGSQSSNEAGDGGAGVDKSGTFGVSVGDGGWFGGGGGAGVFTSGGGGSGAEGAGGQGGGGTGAEFPANDPQDGQAETGGGGGGSDDSAVAGGSGGSGVIIIKYTA